MILKKSSLASTTKVASDTDKSTEAREEKCKPSASANISEPIEHPNTRITVLALSRQQLRALKRAEINTIAELAALSNKDLLQISQIGPRTAQKIKACLNAYLDKQRAEQSESFQSRKSDSTDKTPKPVPHAQTPLKALDLSTRSHNTLRRADIHTVGQLASLSEEDLRTISNIGNRTFTEIKVKLADFLAKHPEVKLPSVSDTPLLVEPNIGEQLSGIPLAQISVSRLGLSKLSLYKLKRVGIESIQNVIESAASDAPYGHDLVLNEVIRTNLNQYLGWLIEQDETVLKNEIAGQGISPVYKIILAQTTIEVLINRWLAGLDERLKQVLRLRFGLNGEVSTLQQLAEQLGGVSRERIRQLQSQALLILKKRRDDRIMTPLHGFLYQNLIESGGLLNEADLAALFEGLDLGNVRLMGVVALLCKVNPRLHYLKTPRLVALATYSWDQISQTQKLLLDILTFKSVPTAKAVLLAEFKARGEAQDGAPKDDFLFACLRLHPKIKKCESGLYALKKWRQRNHKTPGDETGKVLDDIATDETTDISSKPFSVRASLASPSISAFDPNTPSGKFESELREKFKAIDLIGELPIDESSFRELCDVIQQEWRVEGRLLIDCVPPALFVTTMVFTARYSDENARHFWQPYSQLVWGLDEAKQYFQNKCRDRFKASIAFLEGEFGFHFPRRSAGDVVQPIYRHAIIPFYLQNEFAAWLKKQWQNILDIPSELLVTQLCADSSLKSLSPTLRTFIESAETANAAAELIANIAQAAKMYAEGETLENISQLLAFNPTRQALWNEFAKIYADQVEAVEAVEKQRAAGSLCWVWSLDDHQMQLRLLNLTVQAGAKPDRVVWVAPDEEPLEASLMEYVDPWDTDEGDWWIDEVFLTDGPDQGKLILLSDEDSILYQRDVPPLPEGPILICRSTQQGGYGIPVGLSGLKGGLWHISAVKDVLLKDGDGQIIQPREELPVPEPLDEQLGHAQAGLYRLDSPLTIWQGEANDTLPSENKLAEIAHQSISAEEATIAGQDNQILGLSPRVPPAYTNFDIWLTIPDATERLINRATLWIKSATKTIQQPLRELRERDQITLSDDGLLKVPLAPLLPQEPATYTLQLRQGLQPILQSPLQFTVLPAIAIQPPESEQLYSPQNLPTCTIRGLHTGQILANDKFLLEEQADGVKVTWTDLRAECALQLRLNHQVIPLAWTLKCVFAWLEPALPSAQVTVTLNELEQRTLEVVAPRDYARFFRLWIGDEEEHKTPGLDFNARGRYSNPMKKDRLYDMIRYHQGRRLEVYIEIREVSWRLFEVRRWPQILRTQVEYNVTPSESHLIFSCSLRRAWPGNLSFQLHNLNNPFASPQLLSQSKLLEKEHLLPCRLSPGNYWLEILSDGERLPLDPAQMQCLVGTARISKSALKSLDMVQLLDYLNGQKKGQVPLKLGQDFVRLLAQEAEQRANPSSLLTPARLFQLATLPAKSYLGLQKERLASLWQPLVRLAFIHDVNAWEEQYGLLPAWATLVRPIWLTLAEYDHISIKVYPELMFRQLHQGVGYAKLKINDEKEPIYVKWLPHPSTGSAHRKDGLVQVIFGLPDRAADSAYAKLDALDMWPIYQCTRCRQLVGKRGWLSEEDEIYKQHIHHRENVKFNDIVEHIHSEAPLLARPYRHRRGNLLQYTYAQKEYIDRHALLSYLEGTLSESAGGDGSYPAHPDKNPISQQSYRHAAQKWIERYQSDSHIRQMLARLVSDRRWQAGLSELADLLLSLAYKTKMPMLAATGRFLEGFEAMEDEEPLLQLDKTILLVALLLRMTAYYPQRTNSLCRRIRLSEDDLTQMLDLAYRACPELLLWSLTWIELFYVHAAE